MKEESHNNIAKYPWICLF